MSDEEQTRADIIALGKSRCDAIQRSAYVLFFYGVVFSHAFGKDYVAALTWAWVAIHLLAVVAAWWITSPLRSLR